MKESKKIIFRTIKKHFLSQLVLLIKSLEK